MKFNYTDSNNNVFTLNVVNDKVWLTNSCGDLKALSTILFLTNVSPVDFKNELVTEPTLKVVRAITKLNFTA